MKTYSAAGISRYRGRFKVRVAQDISRVNVLARNGHEDIDMETLTHPMTKAELAQWFQAGNWHPEAGDAIVRFCVKHAK